MKILMLGWELPPNHVGGLGVVSYQLAEELANSGAAIDFVLPYSYGHPNHFMNIHSATELDHSEQVFNPYKGESIQNERIHEAYEKKVISLADSTSYDIIHAHDWLTLRAALKLRRVSGIPVVAHVHSTEFDRAGAKRGNEAIHRIEEMALRQADQIITVSERIKDKVVDSYRIDPDKVDVVYNHFQPLELSSSDKGVPSPFFDYLKMLKSHDYKIVLSAGRLTVQKGLPYLVEAMSHVIARRPNTLLFIMGGGEQRDELMELVANYGIGKHTLFSDYVNGAGADWVEAFKISDVFVMPSVSEPFGLTPFEAIIEGTPTIISKQSGIAEVMKHTLKVDYWDTQKITNNVLGILENPALSSMISERALEDYNSLSWRESVDKLMTIYHANIRSKKKTLAGAQ